MINELLPIKGRVLPRQNIYFKASLCDSGAEADWTKYTSSFPMFTATTIQQWVVVFPHRNKREVEAFISQIILAAKSMAFDLPLPYL